MAKSSMDFIGEYRIGDAVLYIQRLDSKTWTATLQVFKDGRKYESKQDYKASRLEGWAEMYGPEIVAETIHSDLIHELKESDKPVPTGKLHSLRDAIRERIYG